MKKKASKKVSKKTGQTKLAKTKRQAKSRWHLKLYVAGMTDRSYRALTNLKSICEEHLRGQYDIEIIDLLEKPQLAKGDQIFAIPTLVRKLPTPIKKIIGDLSSSERVLVGLNLKVAAKR